MRRYYLNVHDGRSHLDADGDDHPDGNSARAGGLRWAGQIIAAAGAQGPSDLAWRFEVVDRSGRVRFRTVFTVAQMRMA